MAIRTRSNDFKLKESRFRLGLRKMLFTMREVKHCHRLPRETVDAPDPEKFKVSSDRALSNLIELKQFLLLQEGWTK